MDVSVSQLRNHTARVIAAVESGERVVLLVRGRAVAEIVPRQERGERRPTERFLAELEEIATLATALRAESPSEDFDVEPRLRVRRGYGAGELSSAPE